ncbi:hypothetical protein [Halosimplex amylolyticum]|uniref:hypothetical protein n=1 Tax=Halosimplex amylolyticum TaxID=3396616 RepID=UPI003F57073B
MAVRDGVLAAVERRHSTLYLAASVFMVVFVTNTALRTYQGTSYEPVQQFVAPTGFLLGVVALAGLYPRLADSAPRTALVALGTAAIAAADWTLIAVAGVLETGGVVPENAAFSAITGIVALFSMVFAYGLFGVTSARTGGHGRAVGGLLLLEAVTFVAMIANSVAALGAPVIVFEISHLVAYSGLGIVLRGDRAPTGQAAPSTDPTGR